MSEIHHPNEAAIAESLKLRSAPPTVARLSRRVLIGLGAASFLAVAGALGWALMVKPPHSASAQEVATGAPPPDRLTELPKDYTGVGPPKLGPPLPGDLGRPILDAERAAGTAPGEPSVEPVTSSPAAQAREAVQQRALQDLAAARSSQIFFGRADSKAALVSAPDVAGGPRADPTANVSSQSAGAQTGLGASGASKTILDGEIDRRIASTERLQAPVSPYVVQAGAVLPAALLTGVRSDLPGQVIAQVTENIFDSPTGRFLLIPQGAKLIGAYDTGVVFGQTRVLLAWTRLILPNGRSVVLEKLPAGDAEGFAGLQDKVDHHWGTLFAAAGLSTVLGVGAELGANDTDSAIVTALREGGAQTLNQAGQQAVSKALSLAPTLTIRQGAPVRVLVNRDLVLEPYSQGAGS